MGELESARYAVTDALEAIEFCYEQGWTDGLPVVPPTPERVAVFLDALGLPAEAEIGALPETGTAITAEKIAVNAVMAGCLPAYLPVVVAAVEALTIPAMGLYAWLTSTGSAAPLLIVNGPPRLELGLNAGAGLFGPGPRANATIARAVGLLLRNVCDARPEGLDRSAFGHLGSYAWCIAEDEEGAAWEPLHVERGLPREMGAVTVLAAEAPRLVRNAFGATPEEVLATVADTIAHGGWSTGACLVAIGPEHRAILERAGWSKADVRAYLVERARRPAAELKRAGLLQGGVAPGDAWRLPALLAESDLLVVAAGGPGSFSVVVPPWVGGRAARPVTRAVRVPQPAAVPWEAGAEATDGEVADGVPSPPLVAVAAAGAEVATESPGAAPEGAEAAPGSAGAAAPAEPAQDTAADTPIAGSAPSPLPPTPAAQTTPLPTAAVEPTPLPPPAAPAVQPSPPSSPAAEPTATAAAPGLEPPPEPRSSRP